MAESRGAQSQNRGSHLRVRDDLDAKDVGQTGAALSAEGAEDEVFAFLVEEENAGEHVGMLLLGRM